MSTADETRELLLRYGRTAFAKKGHDRVSLQRDVLEPSGVSNGSFYHQFKDKTDLLVAILDDARARGRFVVEHSATVPDDAPPVERLRERMTLMLDLVNAGEDLVRIQRRERDNPDPRVRRLLREARQQSTADLAERLAQNAARFSDSFDPDRAARLIACFLEAAIVDYLDLPKKQRVSQRDEHATAMAEFIVGGIAGMARITVPSGVTTS